MSDETHQFLALDLGAESGRGELVTLRGDKVQMEEVHRFENRPVRMAGTLFWDFPYLFAESMAAIHACVERGAKLEGIGVDTWGVDFGLLGPDGHLLSNPVHYRDARTEGIHEAAAKVMPLGEIFSLTALQTMPINTLFQLHAMQRAGSPLLDAAETLLMTPDLMHYFLTGKKTSELSIAQTSQLVGVDRGWCGEILDRFGLSADLFPPLMEPATVLGELRGDVADATGAGGVPVVACATHDTGSAVGAVPGEGENWAYLSCGTWSIMGRLMDQPVASERCFETGFSHEITYGGWYQCRNILGLWLVQQLRRKWDRGKDPWDYDRMTAQAADAQAGPLVNVEDPSLVAPKDMEQALLDLLDTSGQKKPASRGELIRCVLESLALQYAVGLDTMGELSGRRPDALYIVGGGAANKLLCQLTANACGVVVHAGAEQCTALGNALGQALGLGVLKEPQQIRDVMRASFRMTQYEPQDQDVWADKRSRYGDVARGGWLEKS
jgi:rhamnulokinase